MLEKNPRWWTTLKINHIYCNISLSETFTDKEKTTVNGPHIFLDVTELPCHFSDSNLIFTKFTCNCTNKQPYIVTDKLSSYKDCKISVLSCPNTEWKTKTLIIQESWAPRRIQWVCIRHVACQKTMGCYFLWSCSSYIPWTKSLQPHSKI